MTSRRETIGAGALYALMTASLLLRRGAFPRPDLFACGVLAVLGAVAAIAGDVVTVRRRDDLSFASSTLSEAAAGQGSVWMDVGMTGLGVALVACSAGLWRWRRDGLRFRAGCGALALTGGLLIVIAWHNGYRDGAADAFDIHKPLVAVMGLGFSAALILLADNLGELDTGYFRFTVIALGLWLVAWPAFVLAPEPIEGAVERVMGLTIIIWLAIAGRLLMRLGRGERLDRGGLQSGEERRSMRS